jgi:hypothetical protein
LPSQSGVAGNLLSAYMSPHPTLGAGGTVFGIVTACLVFVHCHTWILGSQGLDTAFTIAIGLWMNVMMGVMKPYMDNWVFLGGAIGGASMACFFGPRWYACNLPNGMQILIDRPMCRLPQIIESIPECIGEQLNAMKRHIPSIVAAFSIQWNAMQVHNHEQ